MGMLEDLLMGLMGGGGRQQYRPLSPFSTASPEKEEEMRRYYQENGLLGGMADEIAARDVIGLSDTEISGYKAGRQTIPTQADAQARFAEVDRMKAGAEEAERIEKGGAEIDALRGRARSYQDAVAEDKIIGVPGTEAYIDALGPDKMRAIKEQALAKGGITGGQPGEPGAVAQKYRPELGGTLKDYLMSRRGGSFSVAPDSPEIQMRLAQRDKWLGQEHPLSMAEFMLSPEQIRRNPQGIAAAEQLRGIAGERRSQEQTGIANEIVRMIGDSRGRIPFERANQLNALGFNVPVRSIGSSVDDAVQFLDMRVMDANKDMERVDPYDMTGHGRTVQQFARASQLFAEQLKAKVLSGEMSPDDAMDAFWQHASQNAMELGLLQTQQPQEQQQEK